MRPDDCACRTLVPRLGENHVFGALMIPHPGRRGAAAFFFLPVLRPPLENPHLLYACDICFFLSRDHRLVAVALVRSNGAPALAAFYLVDILHAVAEFRLTNNGAAAMQHAVDTVVLSGGSGRKKQKEFISHSTALYLPALAVSSIQVNHHSTQYKTEIQYGVHVALLTLIS